MLGYNVGGVQVTGESAKAVAAVYGCCGLIADNVGGLPTQLRDGPDLKSSKPLPPSPLLEQPYVEISRRDWWVQFIWGLALHGNFYGQIIERDRLDLAVQVKPIHNANVKIKRLDDGTLQYYFYNQPVPIRDVVHVRYQSSPGSIVGMSPVEVCAVAFGIPMAQDRYAEMFFMNSADPRGVIEVPGSLPRPEAKKMMRGWVAAHQGINQGHLPAILTEGATFKPITISPVDSQLLEALQFSEQRICGRIFRVPPHMVGIVDKSTSWGKGIEQQKRGFVEDTLPGYLTIGQEMMTALHRKGTYMHFDTTRITRGATLERAQAGGALMDAGVAMADDIRDWFDWAPLPGGDGQNTFIPINTQLLEAAVFALKQAKEAPPPSALPPAEPGDGTPNSPQGPPRVPAKTNGNGNGKPPGVTRDQAEAIVRQALAELEERGQHDLLQTLAEREPMNVNVYPPNVTVERTEVSVEFPEMRVEAPQVTVDSPDVTVHPPNVNVELPEVRVEPAVVNVEAPHVHVEPTPVHVDAPNVTVHQPEVRIGAPEVHFDPRIEVEQPSVTVNPQIHLPKPGRTVKKVQRNEKGQIDRVIEEDA